MEFCYNGLWKMLIDKNMLRKDLMKEAGINSSTIAKMGKGQPVSLRVLGKICQVLDCSIGDIVDVADRT